MRRRRAIPAEVKTDVFVALERLIRDWANDPDRLAVAVAAYELGGWCHAEWAIWGMGTDRALRVIDAALRGRDRRLLRHRAEGLLLACEALAPAAERDRLHAHRVESVVIECRELSVEERIDKLRAREGTK